MRSKNQCSMCPAIHTKSRSWLRSSSTREPSDPLLRVVFSFSVLFWSAFEFRTDGRADGPRDSSSREGEGGEVAERFSGDLRLFAPRTAVIMRSIGREALARNASRVFDVVANRPRGGATLTIMILPQVHLRKPCYDFYFL